MMRCCCRERKPEERGSVRRLPAAPHCCLSRAQTSVYTDLATISSIHPSACVTRERAAAPAAASVLPSRQHGPPSTSFLHRTCERTRVPRATILWGEGDERS